VAGFRFSV